jgi:hypothetical protein
MEISKTPTEWLLVKAGCDDDFTNVNFVLVNTNQDFKDTLTKRVRVVNELESDNEFYNVSFWSSPNGWFDNPNEDIEILLDEISDYDYVTLSADDEADMEDWIGNLQQPTTQVMKISKYGEFWFTAYGKYDGSAWYTQKVLFKDIIQ